MTEIVSTDSKSKKAAQASHDMVLYSPEVQSDAQFPQLAVATTHCAKWSPEWVGFLESYTTVVPQYLPFLLNAM